jgi:hypothetical protein
MITEWITINITFLSPNKTLSPKTNDDDRDCRMSQNVAFQLFSCPYNSAAYKCLKHMK